MPLVDNSNNLNTKAKALLENTKEHKRGLLKLFLGAAPGVGKTYAMLTEARELRKLGLDIVVGYVETHNRRDTQALLDGLEIIKRKEIQVNNFTYHELDVQEIIRRHPATVIVDEMPHSNPPGEIHQKRWQDIEDILNAGINVFSALNIQHLESLNSVISRVTNVYVNETIPDAIFDRADEVRLVDLPPDDLISRLQSGKIYLPEIVKKAQNNYFKKSNLIALRELSLRAMTNRLDQQVKQQHQINSTTNSTITNFGLLLVLDGIVSKDAIREASRIAKAFSSSFHCAYILRSSAKNNNKEISELLDFAENLGAQNTIFTTEFPYCIKDYVKEHNLSLVAFPQYNEKETVKKLKQLNKLLPNISVFTLPYNVHLPSFKEKFSNFIENNFKKSHAFFITSCLTFFLTIVLMPISNYINQTNLVMFYLLLVLFTSVKFGIYAAHYVSILSILCFDLTMISPRGSFAVHDLQYLITFATFLVIGIFSARLISRLRNISKQARNQEKQTKIMYNIAKKLAKTIDSVEVYNTISANLANFLDIPNEFWEIDKNSGEAVRLQTKLKNVDKALINFVISNKQEAGYGTNTLNQSKYLYVPIVLSGSIHSICVMDLSCSSQYTSQATFQILQAIFALTKQTIERLESVEEAKQTILNMEAEKLRHTLIQALSHDLKTPLSAIMTNAEILYKHINEKTFDNLKFEAEDLVESTQKLVRLMSNILEISKLQSNKVELNRDWIPADEIIGATLHEFNERLKDYKVIVDVSYDCPLLYVDPILIDRLLANLLDNAIKYCPKQSTIKIAAYQRGDKVILSVSDNGPGFGQINPQRLFDPFKRGNKESKVTGIGLGLAICKTIARAHDADLIAMPSSLGGATFILIMPIIDVPYTEDTCF